MAKPVAIIIVNYKKPLYTIACIRSLYQYCDQELFDIIVIENGSGDGSIDILSAHFPDLIFLVQQQNLGFAEGNNQGLKYSIEKGYQYSLIINNDTLVDEDLVSKLSAYLNIHNEVAAVQPAIYWMHDTARLWNGPGFYNKWLGDTYNINSDNIANSKEPINAEWLTGCCMLVRNSAFKKAGLFNSKFFLYYEDVELSYRLRSSGKLIYLPTAKLYHEAGVSGKSQSQNAEGFLSPVIHYYFSRNRLWFVRMRGNIILYPLNLIFILGYYSALWLYFKLKGRNQKAGYVLKGLTEGLFYPLPS